MNDVAIWQVMKANAEATERVAQRQIDLLMLQRQVINDQLEKETQRRDNAVRDVLLAEKMISECAAPPAPQMVVDKLDTDNAEHRAREWRGQAGEVWFWDDVAELFVWSFRHRQAAPVGGKDVGGPFTELLP